MEACVVGELGASSQYQLGVLVSEVACDLSLFPPPPHSLQDDHHDEVAHLPYPSGMACDLHRHYVQVGLVACLLEVALASFP
ncbi:hypothetical protein DVH24_016433 [Malus domestica]|uniref:Uncharacterized protein n=1 Tax=Malus domestica TaxID=3750 RepID=A0A498HWR6_MALDO|nr:hypothetical protein DVH24_016433 [Malus domestica]